MMEPVLNSEEGDVEAHAHRPFWSVTTKLQIGSALLLILSCYMEWPGIPLLVGILWLLLCMHGVLIVVGIMFGLLALTGGFFFWPDSIPDDVFVGIVIVLPTILSLMLNPLLRQIVSRLFADNNN